MSNKREAAKILRKAANNLDKYGWVQGTYGSTNKGFCAVGSIGHVADQMKASDGGALAEYAADYLAKKTAHSTGVGGVIDFNDSKKFGSKEAIQKIFRTAARELEHGLSYKTIKYNPVSHEN